VRRRGMAWLFRVLAAVALAGGLSSFATVALPAGAAASNGSQGVSAKSLTVGVVASLTGPLASEGILINKSFDAAIAAQNAKGGVDGRKITLVTEDDAGTSTQNLSAAQSLVEEHHALVVVELTSFLPDSIQYLYSNKIPVVTPCNNTVPGTEPYTNSFCDTGSWDPNPNDYSTTYGKTLKSLGVKHVGSLGLQISAASQAVASDATESAHAEGLTGGYLNQTVVIGTTDWTPYILAMKAAGVDGYVGPLDAGDNIAFYQAAEAQGLKLKAVMVNAFNESFVQSPSVSEDQGVYGVAEFAPPQLKSAGALAEDAVLRKYAHIDYPAGFDESHGYVTGLLTIEGLQVAGQQPTRSSYISNLRNVTSWTADGLEPEPVDFKTVFGHNMPSMGNGSCIWLLQIQGHSFHPVDTKPICGATIHGS
jgi:branched-chain amino acid transport system substrate-binding protein